MLPRFFPPFKQVSQAPLVYMRFLFNWAGMFVPLYTVIAVLFLAVFSFFFAVGF